LDCPHKLIVPSHTMILMRVTNLDSNRKEYGTTVARSKNDRPEGFADKKLFDLYYV